MRLFVLFLMFISVSFAQTNLESPRETFRTFLRNMVQVKNNIDKETSYKAALSTFNLSHIDETAQAEIGKKYADQLINVFDRLEKIDYQDIPDKLEDSRWIYDKRDDLVIELSKVENKWQFTKRTLDSLEDYLVLLKDKEVVKSVIALEDWRVKLRSKLPSWSTNKFLSFELWQILFLLGILLISFLIERIIMKFAQFLLNQNFKLFTNAPNQVIEDMLNPLGKILMLYITLITLSYLDLSPGTLAVMKRMIYILTSFMSVWFGHRLVQALSFYLNQKAQLTETRFDDIIIPLLTKTSFVIVYIIGALIVARSLTFDVTGMIAGLGIGGLAFAFAAKDTLANFFGSIMLVLDRPFDIGDVIKSGELEGTVVEVGFRSTRIKTFYDSIISVSNGDLINRSIDNLGKRQYRRLNTTLGLEYDTPPQKIEAFCEGIRQLILTHKWTRKDYFNVYFTGYGASSLDITLMVFWQTDDYTRELQEKHRLMIDILRLAKELEVNFAFPTTTVHLFNQEQMPIHKDLEKYIEEGIAKAQKVVTKPFSLKNPRSNQGDKGQFGENDFGL